MRSTEHRLGGRVHAPLPQNVVIRQATTDDAASLAPRLRRCDADEVFASSGRTPEQALAHSIHPTTFVAVLDGTPEVIFGCPRHDDITGTPWLLGSPVVFSPQWRLPFNRFGLNLVEHWQRQYPLLHNFTDARNVVHHRWLRWLGFKFIARRERYGALGLPFLEFVRTSHV